MPRYLLIVKLSFLVSLCLVIVACNSIVDDSEANEMTEVSKQAITETFSKKVYFGHQSVGKNILHGMALVAPDKTDQIIALEGNKRTGDLRPAFYHSLIGENLDPKRKINDFRDVVENSSPVGFDVAFLKFCYLDIDKNSNVVNVFTYYKQVMEQLKKTYPKTVFVHVTVPLTKNSGSWKTELKKLLGKDDLWEYSDNIKRNQFNRILLDEYSGKEPVFDIAKVESTHPDGTRETFSFKGEQYYALIADYTTDGGHLNQEGSKKVAAALINFISDL